jgi:hypothetical protein
MPQEEKPGVVDFAILVIYILYENSLGWNIIDVTIPA